MNRQLLRTVMMVALSVVASACDKTDEPAPSTSSSSQALNAAPSVPTPNSLQVPAAPTPTPAPTPSPSASASASAAPANPALLKPDAAKAQAPAKFKVKFTTTKGDFIVESTRAWAPIGVDRFYNLVKLGFYDDAAFFRVVPGFVAQFGIHGDPQVSAAWRPATIPDDPKSKQSNERGTLTYAKGGPNSRTTQLFINFAENPRLDSMGFPPIGKVTQGMDVVDKINAEYKELPQQQRLQSEGNAYLRWGFANLDYIKSATLMK